MATDIMATSTTEQLTHSIRLARSLLLLHSLKMRLTSLGAEVVLNRMNNNFRIVFIVFDVLILNGTPMSHKPFGERLNRLKKFFQVSE